MTGAVLHQNIEADWSYGDVAGWSIDRDGEWSCLLRRAQYLTVIVGRKPGQNSKSRSR